MTCLSRLLCSRFVVGALSVSGAYVSAQIATMPADVEAGAAQYGQACSSCHGVGGDERPPMNLLVGRFLRPLDDAGLVQVIREGTPGGRMPPSNISARDAARIVAYLRWEIASSARTMPPGDVARGRALFDKSGCLACHRTAAGGAYTGPDLTDLGSRGRSYADLERAVFDPEFQIAPENREVRVILKDGTVFPGRLLNHDAMSVQIMDRQSQLRSFMKATLQSFEFIDKSSMPSYRGKLSPQDAADIINFLYSEANR